MKMNIMQGCTHDFYGGGGGGGRTLVQPLGGLVACSPDNFLYSTLDSGLILEGGGGGGGGGNSSWRGGNPSAPPPPLYATLLCL